MCKQKASGYCLSSKYSEYEDAIQNHLSVVSDDNQKPHQKRQASELMGEAAAIFVNAERHNWTFEQSRERHFVFHGAGVFDLVYMDEFGNVEIKEAKGGSGQYGSRRDHLHGGRCTQCTPRYTEVLIDKYMNSKYRGRHPDTACDNHQGNPDGGCNDCKNAEAKFRQFLGEELNVMFYNDSLTKITVRGDYNGECPIKPQVIEDYTIINGKKVSNI